MHRSVVPRLSQPQADEADHRRGEESVHRCVASCPQYRVVASKSHSVPLDLVGIESTPRKGLTSRARLARWRQARRTAERPGPPTSR